MKKNLLISLTLTMITIACKHSTEQHDLHESLNLFAIQSLQEIYDLQDRRETDSLLIYFNDEDPVIRENAALAFGSVQDPKAAPTLTRLLKDDVPKVRIAAAYALGQLKDTIAETSLINALEIENTPLVRKELLESLGKCITQKNLMYFVIQDGKDSLEREGMAWGLYRAGIRGVHDDSTTQIIVQLLDTINTHETRLGAAHYLSRTSDLNLDKYQDRIIKSAMNDKSPFVRMASTAALRHVTNEKTLEALKSGLLKDRDYRVRINAARVTKAYTADQIASELWVALKDKNHNVSIAAAQSLAAISSQSINLEKISLASSVRAKSILVGAAIKSAADPSSVITFLQQNFNSAVSPYEKADWLTALGNDVNSYQFVVTEMFKAEHPAISTAGIIALGNMRKSADFPHTLTKAFAEIFKNAIASNDIALIGNTASILSTPELGFSNEYTDISFLYEAKKRLTTPKDVEAILAIQKVIDLFENNKTSTPTRNEYNHPIDWDLVKTIPKQQKVRVSTSKGDFVLQLIVEASPGTVGNFVALVKQGYFDQKNFHRVVPNFVVQGGCNRGDGWGSENYSIRSEFANLRYKEGSVGMASAGKDTECTQWFITHSPTPHLDGRYTIFAKVIEGMEVVHRIAVSDTITKITLL